MGTTEESTTEEATTEEATTEEATTEEATTQGGSTSEATTQGGSTSTKESTSTTEGSTGCSIQDFEDDGNGNCYLVVLEDKQKHNNAKKQCEKLGAVLATIQDETSNDFIKEKIAGNTWIGGEDKNGAWAWHNGDEWDFEKWKSGEGQSADECAAMMTNGKWIDKACNTKMDYVCMEE